MSDTPRTDQLEQQMVTTNVTYKGMTPHYFRMDGEQRILAALQLCRQLERELGAKTET